MSDRSTDVDEFIADLDAGVLKEKIAYALSNTALAAVTTGKEASINLTLKIKQIKNLDQVSITHKFTMTKPTNKGKSIEEDGAETSMYVHKGGKLKFYPADQGQLFGEKA